MELIVAPLLTAVGATGAASAATALGTSGLFAGLGALGTVVSGVSSIMAGQQQQAMYGLQAQQYQMQSAQAMTQARGLALKAKSDEIKYMQQGVMVLDRTLSTAATIRARAGAGSLDPFSGSAGALTTYAFGKGFGEFNLAQESAELTREAQQMAMLTGEMNAAAFGAQAAISGMLGEQAAMAGMIKGAGNIFSGLYSASQIGGPTLLTPASQTATFPSNVPLPPYRPAGI